MKCAKYIKILTLVLCIVLLLCSCAKTPQPESFPQNPSESTPADNTAVIPEFTNSAFIAINDNQPEFSPQDLVTESYESYSSLDTLGRCGVAVACIGRDIMPTEDRGSIGQVKPSGWHTAKYDIVDGKYLYNRCHLIGYQLTGENANEKNLITGTRYLNIEGMLPFENMIADYVKETGNHVLYRVTPVFDGDNLLASGVKMEALSIEDSGEGICFNVYAYNAQPGIAINYKTGESALGDVSPDTPQAVTYILNTSTKKIHLPSCPNAKDIKNSNKKETNQDLSQLVNEGYSACKACIS